MSFFTYILADDSNSIIKTKRNLKHLFRSGADNYCDYNEFNAYKNVFCFFSFNCFDEELVARNAFVHIYDGDVVTRDKSR